MLQHIECPRCGTLNLTSEVICFACGAALRPSRRRLPSEPAPEVPWPLWIGLVVALVAAALVAYHISVWAAAYRQRAALASWHLPVGGVLLIVAGRLASWEARRRDRRWWRLRRAPELKLSQVSTGDVIWTRGRLECDTPLIAPYVNQPCAYYRYTIRERNPDEGGWRETERGTKAVDFRIVDDEESVYVPTGSVLLDAPFYGDSILDGGGHIQLRAWLLPVGMPVSLCGELAGEARRPRLDPVAQGVPAVATWRLAKDYVALVGKRARRAQLWGWIFTILGALALVAGIAGK
jgi:hypothetical protein